MTNRPYYNAPDFLEHIYTINNPSACYDFSDVLVVKDTRDGKFYVAHDSGCSCPSPFESHTFPTDFTEIRAEADLYNFVNGVLYTQYAPADIQAYAPADIQAAVEAFKSRLDN